MRHASCVTGTSLPHIGTQAKLFQTTPHGGVNQGMGNYFFAVVEKGRGKELFEGEFDTVLVMM